MTKIEVIRQKPSKTEYLAKIAIFGNFWPKKTLDFKFSYEYHYLHTLEDTQEKTLGSFQPKIMTKIKVISQNLQKNCIFGKNGHFLTVFGQKILDFEFFYGYHYSHTLEDTQEKTLGSFQPKLMTKIEVINRKLPK